MKERLWSAGLIACVIAFDRVTKIYVREHYMPWDVTRVIPGFFDIVHAENPGAAFGMLADSTAPWRSLLLVGISLVVMAAIGWMLWKPSGGARYSATMRAGLSLIFAGAAGNLWDRLFRGTVTDFLELYHRNYQFPAFNAADSAITIGAVLLLIDMWFGRKPGISVRT